MSTEWRMLGPEDVIKEGDEYAFKGEQVWTPVHNECYGYGLNPWLLKFDFRRRVSPESKLLERAERAEAMLNVKFTSFWKLADEVLSNYKAKLQQVEAERDHLIKAFAHNHVRKAGEDYDTCARCGLDLRNPIHHRIDGGTLLKGKQ